MANSAIRISALLIFFLLATAVFLACGDDDDRQADANATGCDALAATDSYRYAVSLKLQSPATATPAVTPTEAPLTAFTDALTALFSDFSLNGAYRSPDRSQAILRFQNEDLELRTIGQESWVRIGSSWQEQKTDATAGLLTPSVVCRDIVSQFTPSLSKVTPKTETVNGLEADHYTLNDRDLGHLPQVLGKTLPEKYVVDLWLAKKGAWPVQLRINSSDTNEKGEPLGFLLAMDVRDVNDKGILIDAPTVADGSQ